jgi:hypothetical protein
MNNTIPVVKSGIPDQLAKPKLELGSRELRMSDEAHTFELPNWKRTVGRSRYMTYTSELERELILYASDLAGTQR